MTVRSRRAGPLPQRARLLGAAALALVAVVTLSLLFTALDTPPGEAAGGNGVGSGGGSNGGTSPFDGFGDGTGGAGSGSSQRQQRGPDDGHQDCTVAYILGGVLGTVGALILGHGLVKRVPRRELAYRGLAAAAFVGLGAMMVITCGYEPEPSPEKLPPVGNGGGGGGQGDGNGNTNRDGERPVEDPITPPDLPWLLIALIAGLAVVAVAAYFLLRTLRVKRPPGDALPEQAKAEAAAVLRGNGGLAALSADTHEAVVEAYTRFLAASALLGAPRLAHETPREHARLAPTRTGFPPEAVEAIVEAYETVRYAERAPPPEARERALSGLRRILEHREVATAAAAASDSGGATHGG